MQKFIEAQQLARAKFDMDQEWVVFFREVLGVDGIVRKMFPSEEEMAEFEKSEEYAEIHTMLAKLREKNKGKTLDCEPTRVITVRLPVSLHQSLRVEADERNTSVNQLCISKLIQFIDGDYVPSDVPERAPKETRAIQPQTALEAVV
ncbi:MAG: hypothetical protein SGJ20_01910 [Planctomycetota bacterium]|nr:hypothetical protein [Planctomycetota bacterium]